MPSRKINASELRVADIIVSTTDHALSRSIRTSIGADISHAMLYVGSEYVIEATGAGVTKSPLWSGALSGATLAIALRRTGMSEENRQAVVKAALPFEGRAYDKIGAAGSGMTGKRMQAGAVAGCIISPVVCAAAGVAFSREVSSNASDDNKDKMFFCSELVARAFELAGVPIVDGSASYVNPRAIRVSAKLQYVGHLVGL